MTAERLDHFMARAVAAYYAGHDPFGTSGDFTTAPEISQIFGECLGLWATVGWHSLGAPERLLLVELGPGRGTLMADVLRAAELTPAFRAAITVALVETSPRLRAMQRAKLPEATHHESVATLPPGPAIFLANEFLDALPIRQFLFRAGRWAERWVEAGRLVERPGHLPCLPDQAPDGAVMEVCEPARALAGHLAQRFAASPGLALFLDYGPEASGFGDSLQALRDARPADPLAEPGSADLTAHVDFAAFARAARAGGAAAHGPVPQGLFLQRLGLHRRAAALASRHPGSAAAILAAAHRLTAPEAMGQLFKALCLCHVDLPPPAGFEAP